MNSRYDKERERAIELRERILAREPGSDLIPAPAALIQGLRKFLHGRVLK